MTASFYYSQFPGPITQVQPPTQCDPELPQKEQDLEEIVLIQVLPELEKITFYRL